MDDERIRFLARRAIDRLCREIDAELVPGASQIGALVVNLREKRDGVAVSSVFIQLDLCQLAETTPPRRK